MKDNRMKLKLTLLALTCLVTSAAVAQTIDNTKDTALPLNLKRVTTIVQNSATVPLGADVNPYEGIFAYCVGTAATTSVSLIFNAPDGTPVSTSTVNCTTTGAPVLTAAAGTHGVSSFLVSPTAGLTSTNTVKTIVVRQPSPYIYRQ